MKYKQRRKKFVGGNILERFCAKCDEGGELNNYPKNGDENIERLSRNLSKLNLRTNAGKGINSEKPSYIKF